jgi:hypothetical protein
MDPWASNLAYFKTFVEHKKRTQERENNFLEDTVRLIDTIIGETRRLSSQNIQMRREVSQLKEQLRRIEAERDSMMYTRLVNPHSPAFSEEELEEGEL